MFVKITKTIKFVANVDQSIQKIYMVVIIKVALFRPTYSLFWLTDIDEFWHVSYIDSGEMKSAIKINSSNVDY